MPRPPKFADDAEVVDRAVELFWVRGADAVTIRDLEVALELRAPSIYRRFETKDVLLARCVDRYVDRVIAGRVRRFLDESDDPVAGIREFFTSVLRPHPGEISPRGCLLTNTAAQAAGTTPQVTAALTRGFEAVGAGLRRSVERASATGRVDADAVDATAVALHMSFQGLLVVARNDVTGLEESIDVTLAALLPRREHPGAA